MSTFIDLCPPPPITWKSPEEPRRSEPTLSEAAPRRPSPCPASDGNRGRRITPRTPNINEQAHRLVTLAEWTHRKRSNWPIQPLPPPGFSCRAASRNVRRIVSHPRVSRSRLNAILNSIIRPVMHYQLIGRKRCVFDARTMANLARRLRFDVLPGPVVPVLCRRRVTLRY